MKNILILIILTFSLKTAAQSFANTSSGTVGSNNIPTGWTAVGSPDYSSISINGYSSTTPWSSTLPAAPNGDSTFPITRSANPNVSLVQTINGLTSGIAYNFTIHYMFPTATGTFTTRFNRPVSQCAYARFDTGAIQYFDTFGFTATTNYWYTQTFSATPTTSSLVLQLGMTGANQNRAAVAYSFTATPVPTYLPVDFISFKTHKNTPTSVALAWITASEYNNKGFMIQWSSDNEEWQDLAFEDGTNENKQTQYSYVDERPLRGLNYYRIKQLDFDGSFSLSKTQSLKFGSHNGQIKIYPNPTNEALHIEMDHSHPNLTVQITTADGTLRQELNITYSATIDLSGLKAGVYLIRVNSNGQTLYTEKLIVQH